MDRVSGHSEILKWIEIIPDKESDLIRSITSDPEGQKKIFIDQIAEFLYTDLKHINHLFTSPYLFRKDYRRLTDEEKRVWNGFASEIPDKLKSLNLFIRPYKDFCRTCLIPYHDLEKLARADRERYYRKIKYAVQGKNLKQVHDPEPVSFNDLKEDRKRFYVELNHLIPIALKKIGYEIVRPEEIAEINDRMVRKLARAIHSRYLHEIRKQYPGPDKKSYISWIHNLSDEKNSNITDFDDLPEEIKHSNLDNAYHIPTKLLSIGYKIRSSGKGYKPAALHLSKEEIEIMARVEHIRWCWDKILHGWHFGNIRDDRKRTHPSIIPFEDLTETEKEKDRELVRLIPALLQDISYEAFPVNPDRISKLPYAIKPQSSIHKILDETSQMNLQIRKMVTLSPEMEEMIRISNNKIEEAIREIESSYHYAQHIQETYLPDDLYVRECFADSFILFKPIDIVSGDFYFFSKNDNAIIFAVADCTGHGIPGALLSTLGYGILDNAVNELKITSPSLILTHLYSRIHRFLRKDTWETDMSDDMDIVLCILDTRSNVLTFTGVRIPLYHIASGELKVYRTGNLPEECPDEGECHFASESIQLKTGDTIYLCSDGYPDQFGGRNHKKYQSTRFKSFLQSIQDYSMPEQCDMLYEELEKWREENKEDQTDDILVIGIKI